MTRILNIDSDKGALEIKWSNMSDLVHFSSMQNGGWGVKPNSDTYLNLHNKFFKPWHEKLWNIRKDMGVFDLPDSAKIMDIGCGLAVMDLLLYSYANKPNVYLVDKEESFDPESQNYFDITYSEKHPFYHSWSPIVDAIETSGFDRNKFMFLEPNDSFPNELDLVLSSFSWCWHYPKEFYWDRVLTSLKRGGKLYLDVKVLPDRNMIDEISEELKSEPKLVSIPMPANPDYMDTGIGYHCLWTKNI